MGSSSPAALPVRIPDWPHNLAASVAHRAWTRVTWGRLVQVHGLVDLPVHGDVLLVAALGAARVRVHGLVNCVRDGVLLVPWWKVPVNMQPKFQQSLPIDSQWKVPFPFIVRVLDIAGMLQRQIRTVYIVQKSGESTAHFLDVVVSVPVVANDRNEWVQTVQTQSGSAASAVLVVVDVAVSMRRQVRVLLGGASDQFIDKVVDCVCGFSRRFTHFSHPSSEARAHISALEHTQL